MGVKRQEQRIAREKAAAEQATAIVGEAIANIKRKRGEATDEERALGQRVKELRDGGMAWWQIAHEMGLPGSADNVAEGKGGAARARLLYKKAFGDLPASPRSLAAQRGDRVFGNGPKPTGTRRRDTITRDPEAVSMFEGHSDEDIVNMLRGKRIVWRNTISGVNEEVRTHEKAGMAIVDCPSGRAVQFREGQTNDVPMQHRWVPGPYRTVRLDAIIRVSK
jgi:hypothetical protein